MKAFQMAAERQADVEENGADENKVEFSIGEYEFTGTTPTPAQVALLIGTSSLGGSASLGAAYRFLRGTLDRSSYNQLLTLIEAGKISQDMLVGGEGENEEGIVDWLIEQASDRPTQAPTGSSASSQAGGKKSTGRSPGKGSTLSD